MADVLAYVRDWHAALATGVGAAGGQVMATSPLQPHTRLATLPYANVLSEAYAARTRVGVAIAAAAAAAGASLAATPHALLLAVMMWQRRQHKADAAPFGVYLRSIPRKYDNPLWWSDAQRALLRGTNLERTVAQKEADLRTLFHALAPILNRLLAEGVDITEHGAESFLPMTPFTYDDLLWAKSAFMSRGFPDMLSTPPPPPPSPSPLPPPCTATPGATDCTPPSAACSHTAPFARVVAPEALPDAAPREDGDAGGDKAAADTMSGIGCMLPVLDIFNHKHRAKITWERGPEGVTFWCEEALPAGAEVFNNYGPKSNEELLMGYGFVLADNPCDTWRMALPPMAASRLCEASEGALPPPPRDFMASLPTHFVARVPAADGAYGALPPELLQDMRLRLIGVDDLASQLHAARTRDESLTASHADAVEGRVSASVGDKRRRRGDGSPAALWQALRHAARTPLSSANEHTVLLHVLRMLRAKLHALADATTLEVCDAPVGIAVDDSCATAVHAYRTWMARMCTTGQARVMLHCIHEVATRCQALRPCIGTPLPLCAHAQHAAAVTHAGVHPWRVHPAVRLPAEPADGAFGVATPLLTAAVPAGTVLLEVSLDDCLWQGGCRALLPPHLAAAMTSDGLLPPSHARSPSRANVATEGEMGEEEGEEEEEEVVDASLFDAYQASALAVTVTAAALLLDKTSNAGSISAASGAVHRLLSWIPADVCNGVLSAVFPECASEPSASGDDAAKASGLWAERAAPDGDMAQQWSEVARTYSSKSASHVGAQLSKGGKSRAAAMLMAVQPMLRAVCTPLMVRGELTAVLLPLPCRLPAAPPALPPARDSVASELQRAAIAYFEAEVCEGAWVVRLRNSCAAVAGQAVAILPGHETRMAAYVTQHLAQPEFTAQTLPAQVAACARHLSWMEAFEEVDDELLVSPYDWDAERCWRLHVTGAELHSHDDGDDE